MSSEARGRVRDILPKLYLGRYQPGKQNSITDVEGVLVSTLSVHESPVKKGAVVNTGITTIVPRKDWFDNACHAAIFRFNGSGEMMGAHWIEETGFLNSAIQLTNSYAAGVCYTGIWNYAIKHHASPDGTIDWFILPVVSETYDGFLNDIAAVSITAELSVKGIEAASDAAVEEGNTGGGTGMTSLGHKAGTGSASRLIPGFTLDSSGKKVPKTFTVAALVQSNFGGLHFLTIGGAPIGRLLEEEQEARNQPNPVDKSKAQKDGSIVVIIATDAPMHPTQLERLAKRATTGVGRLGGWGSNKSGDLFLAFSTGNNITAQTDDKWKPVAAHMQYMDDTGIESFLEAVPDVVEESIYNALCMAKTMEGRSGHRADALDLEWLKKTMTRYL